MHVSIDARKHVAMQYRFANGTLSRPRISGQYLESSDLQYITKRHKTKRTTTEVSTWNDQ